MPWRLGIWEVFRMATKKQQLFSPVIFNDSTQIRPPVDDWVPSEEDMIFKTVKGAIITDISSFYGLDNNPNLDSFYLAAKRSYNNQKLRDHLVQYLNYFEKYYDFDKELPTIYATMKYLIDYEPSYTKEALFYDIRKRIIFGPLAFKAERMVRDNYQLDLEYSNKKNPALQYTDKHAMLLLKISLLMNMMIPLLCHFLTVRKIRSTIDFLMEIYDDLLHINPDVDIYAKLYETALTNVSRMEKKNPIIFAKQDIRGLNVSTHSAASTINIILNLIPKYIFSANHINLNYRSIKHNTAFQITDIEWCVIYPAPYIRNSIRKVL